MTLPVNGNLRRFFRFLGDRDGIRLCVEVCGLAALIYSLKLTRASVDASLVGVQIAAQSVEAALASNRTSSEDVELARQALDASSRPLILVQQGYAHLSGGAICELRLRIENAAGSPARSITVSPEGNGIALVRNEERKSLELLSGGGSALFTQTFWLDGDPFPLPGVAEELKKLGPGKEHALAMDKALSQVSYQFYFHLTFSAMDGKQYRTSYKATRAGNSIVLDLELVKFESLGAS